MIKIKINKETRQVNLSKSFLGNDKENLQNILEFSFINEFVNGQARLELQFENGDKTFIVLDKVDQTYTTPVTNIMTKQGKVYGQLVITEGTSQEQVPLFKSNMFYFYVSESINAQTGADEPYIEWIDKADAKLNEVDNLDIDAVKIGTTATITITQKDGIEKEVEIYDGTNGLNGQDGKDGKDGTNGQDGVSLDYNWSGTSLGIKKSDEQNYEYVNLKGDTGASGQDGSNGITPTIGDNGNWYIGTTDTGKPSRGVAGQDGNDGSDGYSPTATVSKAGSTATISITDKNGTTTAQISDGTNGTNGTDGFSPSASVSQSGDTTTISITDKDGTTTASIDLSNKLDTSKVKTNTSTTSGDVYDVTYINTMLGNVETLLSEV